MHGWSLPACLPSKCVFVLLPSKGPTGRQAGTQGSSAVVHTTAQYSTVLVSHPPKPSCCVCCCCMLCCSQQLLPSLCTQTGPHGTDAGPFCSSMHAQGTTGMHACMDLHTKAILHTCVFHGCRIDEWLCPELFWRIYAYTNLF